MAMMSHSEVVEWTEQASCLVETRRTGNGPLTDKQRQLVELLKRKMEDGR